MTFLAESVNPSNIFESLNWSIRELISQQASKCLNSVGER